MAVAPAAGTPRPPWPPSTQHSPARTRRPTSASPRTSTTSSSTCSPPRTRAAFPVHPAAAARRVFAHMLEAGAPPSEATIASLGRVVAADAEGADEAFGLVSTMRQKYGLAPRLRSYSPVLAAFRRAGEAGKAYPVEAHMAASAVSPEEPEFAVLLEVSVKVRDADKVYEYMHKLRRAVSCVTEETTEVLEGRFRSEKAAIAGKAEWDVC